MKLIKKVRIKNTKSSPDLYYYPFNDNTLQQKYLGPKIIIVKDITLDNTAGVSLEELKVSKDSLALPIYAKW